MISVEQAVGRVRAAFSALPAETIAIAQAFGRVSGQDVRAKLNQPPFAVSAMDGYALRAADAGAAGVTLKIVGSAPAGHPFAETVGKNQAVRIFTGAVVPDGADTIVIQEDTHVVGGLVTIDVPPVEGRHIRKVGLDFAAGDLVVSQSHRLNARDLSLLAAADVAEIAVRRKPKVLFAATGDELSKPGQPRKPGGIVASSGYGLAAMIQRWGGEPEDLGILPDTADAIASIAKRAKEADIIVTLGGASVGDHDLVQRALGPHGFELDFWKIAMRPGKPLIFGKLGATPLLGLPGNPVSTLVCAMLFLRPAIATMLDVAEDNAVATATLAGDLKANDGRQDYLRARTMIRDGIRVVDVFEIQDSSMLLALAQANALVVRPPHAPAAKQGQSVDIILLE